MVELLYILPIILLLVPVTAFAQVEPGTYVWIGTDQSWTAAVAVNFESVSHDGQGHAKIPIECESGQIYSAVVQKMEPSTSETLGGIGKEFSLNPALTVKIVVDGKIVDEAKTLAQYGVITLSGNC